MTQDHAAAVQAVIEFADGERMFATERCRDFQEARQDALKFAEQLAYVAAMADAALKLEQALREIATLSDDLDIYPAAVKGFNDERDYEQRNGYKNGWNAAITEHSMKMSAIATRALARHRAG